MHANPRGLPGHGGRAERADLYWSAAGRLDPGRDGPAGAAVMTVRSVSRCRAGLAWWRTAAAHSRHRSPSHLATSRGLRAVMRGGSGRRGAALVPDDGDRLPLGEPGASGERLIEPAPRPASGGPGPPARPPPAAGAATRAGRPAGAGPLPRLPAAPPGPGRRRRTPAGRTRPGTGSRTGCCGPPGSGPAPHPAAAGPHRAGPAGQPGCPAAPGSQRRASHCRLAQPGRAPRAGGARRRRSGPAPSPASRR